MPRLKPEISEELHYLRLVMSQEEDKDDPADVILGNYRKQKNEDRKWCISQKRIAETEYRKELASWRAEGKKETVKAAPQTVPDNQEPCEIVVGRLLEEWLK